MITVRADFGGGPEHIYRLIPHLQENYNIFIACPEDYPYREKFSELTGAGNLLIIPHRKFTVPALLELNNFIEEKQIALLHSHGKGAGIYSRLLKILTRRKTVHTFHGIHTGEYGKIQKFIYVLIEKFLTFFTDQFISVSAGEKETAVKTGIAPGNKISIILNGVVLNENFSPGDKVNDKFTVLHVSRFDYQKNSKDMVSIAEEIGAESDINSFKFIMTGDGKEKEDCEKLVQEKGLNEYFTFTGFVTNPNYYFDSADVFVSTSRWEGLPLTVLESMNRGTVPVISDVVGNNDIFENGKCGFLYKPGDVKSAAQLIIDLKNRKHNLQELRSNAYKLVEERYTSRVTALETEKIYKKLLNTAEVK